MLLLISHSAFAAGQAGTDIAVLNAGVGARPLGMGGAFTAIADNADAPYYNPAGLAYIRDQEINTMQTRLSTDADHYYISYVRPLGKGGIGFSWMQVGIGNIVQTTTTDAFNEVITTNVFSYFSNAFLLSYGYPVNPNLSFGLTAKYLTSDMDQITGGQAYGYSITPGILIHFTRQIMPITVGLKIDELINEQKWGTGTVEKAIPKARMGIAAAIPEGLIKDSTIAIDLSQYLSLGYQMEIALGYEWTKENLSLRAGYTDSSISAGAGFRSGAVELDYAYDQETSFVRSNVHRVSLSGKW